MRLRENEIDLVARHVMQRMIDGRHLAIEVAEGQVLERIKKAIVDDLMVEDNLNREVEDILKSHSRDLEGGAIDYRRMFAMIKNKLVRDRNLILS